METRAHDYFIIITGWINTIQDRTVELVVWEQ